MLDILQWLVGWSTCFFEPLRRAIFVTASSIFDHWGRILCSSYEHEYSPNWRRKKPS